MNQGLASHFRRKPVSYIIVLTFLLTVTTLGCREPSESYEEMMRAVESLQAGMSREEAEGYLGAAVSHLRCAFDDAASEELYLFGSDDVTKADTIWVLYHLESGGAIIAAFTNPSREYLQRAPYNNNSCIVLNE